MIHIFCALPCEANPIIQHYKLIELKDFDLHRLFICKNNKYSLTITGIGKLNTASAVSYHHACLKTKPSDIWLNIGIAGHTSITIGEARLVNKISEQQDNKTWYPQIVFKAPCKSIDLITLEKTSIEYQDSLFDMEASAFYQMAIRLGTTELIHCFKIISDNKEHPASELNANKVKQLITAQIQTIEKLLDCLEPLSEEIRAINSEPEQYQYFIEKWHFTQSESIQLIKLLKQWAVRLPESDVIQSVIEKKSGKAVLKILREKIDESEFVIHD